MVIRIEMLFKSDNMMIYLDHEKKIVNLKERQKKGERITKNIKYYQFVIFWLTGARSLPAMSVAKGRSGLQPVYQPTTLPPDTRGRSYALPPTNPTGQIETLRVLRI